MSIMMTRLQVGLILVLLATPVVSSCSKATSPKLLAKTVPGVYEGTELGLKEILNLRPNGDFRHEVFINDNLEVQESGKWSFDIEMGAVRVEPFTSFFDVHSKKTTRKGVRHTESVFFVMLHDTESRTISPSIDFEFRLLKTKSYSTENHLKKLEAASRDAVTNEKGVSPKE